MTPNISRALPLGGAAILLAASGWLWNARRHASVPSQAVRPETVHADALLERTYHADNELQYQAVSDVTAVYGPNQMSSQARIARAPHKMSVTYIAGDMSGVQSGYNEKWFWRRTGGKAESYAEVVRRPQDMAAQRFALLKKNYQARDAGREKMGDNAVRIIEVHPMRAVDGAVGPYKRLWIDEKTGLTLRNDLYNWEGHLVTRSVLSDIDWKPQFSAETFMPPEQMLGMAEKTGWVASDTGTDQNKVMQKTGLQPPRVKWVPDGFALDGYGVHHCPSRREQPILASLARYTDGMNTLTVFVMRPPTNKGGNEQAAAATGETKMPQSCDFGSGTMAMASRGNLKIVAVGDLPSVTLERVLAKTEVSPPGSSKPASR